MPRSVKLVAPDQSYEQRMTALAKANLIRSHRRDLKERVRDRELSAVDLVIGRDPLVESMRVVELLLCVPGIGPAKLRRILDHDVRAAWSKTIGGLTDRQRAAVVMALRRHMALSSKFYGVSFERSAAA